MSVWWRENAALKAQSSGKQLQLPCFAFRSKKTAFFVDIWSIYFIHRLRLLFILYTALIRSIWQYISFYSRSLFWHESLFLLIKNYKQIHSIHMYFYLFWSKGAYSTVSHQWSNRKLTNPLSNLSSACTALSRLMNSVEKLFRPIWAL